jgi:hypothetical protein
MLSQVRKRRAGAHRGPFTNTERQRESPAVAADRRNVQAAAEARLDRIGMLFSTSIVGLLWRK